MVRYIKANESSGQYIGDKFASPEVQEHISDLDFYDARVNTMYNFLTNFAGYYVVVETDPYEVWYTDSRYHSLNYIFEALNADAGTDVINFGDYVKLIGYDKRSAQNIIYLFPADKSTAALLANDLTNYNFINESGLVNYAKSLVV